MAQQRRGGKIAMTSEELDAFLASERTCRVGTVNRDGSPHVSPLWFVWDGSAIWLNSIVRSQRWVNILREPRVCVVVDGGVEFGELRGVELAGSLSSVGEVPRTSALDRAVAVPEQLFGEKYADGTFVADGRHAWLRLVPETVVSWDFRKMSAPAEKSRA